MVNKKASNKIILIAVIAIIIIGAVITASYLGVDFGEEAPVEPQTQDVSVGLNVVEGETDATGGETNEET